MDDVRTIVSAVDFSPASAAATRHAAALARQTGAVLHLVHADVLFGASGDGTPLAVSFGQLRRRLERFADGVLGPGSVATEAIERNITAPAALLGYTSDVGADLLVIGSHGRGRLARMLLGSVAEAVVATSTCPVLTLPTGSATVPASGAPVLVAVDLSDRSRDVLRAGVALAEVTGASVELVHVVRGTGRTLGAAPGGGSLKGVGPAAADPAATVRARLLRFAAGMAVADVHVALGAAGRVLPPLAERLGAGALVIGTHARSDTARARLGSFAQASLRRAPCTVLTLARASRLTAAPVRPALAASFT